MNKSPRLAGAMHRRQVRLPIGMKGVEEQGTAWLKEHLLSLSLPRRGTTEGPLHSKTSEGRSPPYVLGKYLTRLKAM